nr:MAG TPA: hypothetical protein [Caudoviricetes sp.]
MVAVPSATAVAFPCLGVTFTTASLFEVKVIVLSSEFIVVPNILVSPTVSDNVVSFNITPLGVSLFLLLL